MTAIVVRAERRHVEGIRFIYNHAVRHLPASFDWEEKTLADREAWLAAHDERHPVWVAIDGERVLGWSSLSQFSERAAYARTVENSVYIHPDHLGKGLGTLLMAELMAGARAIGHHAVIAKIAGDNAASCRLHRRFGFVDIGVLREVGWKFERWHDVVLMQATI